MKIKFTMAVMAATTLAANAAIVLDSVSSSGNVLTISLSGTLDKVGNGDDINNRNLLFFADKRLGDGTPIDAALGYEDWIGGGNNGSHSISGTLGGVTIGAYQSSGGLSTGLTGSQVAIRRDGNDTTAGDVRGPGSNAGAVDYVVIGFGNGTDTYSALSNGTALDFTVTIALASTTEANALNTPETFSNAFALYANDGSNNSDINANTSNYNQLTLVPEPTSTALIGLGGIALILRRRK